MLRNIFRSVDPLCWLRSQRRLSRRLQAAKKGVRGTVQAVVHEHEAHLAQLAERFVRDDEVWVENDFDLEDAANSVDDTLTPFRGMRRSSQTSVGLFRHNRYNRSETGHHHHRPWWKRRTRVTPRRMEVGEPTFIFA